MFNLTLSRRQLKSLISRLRFQLGRAVERRRGVLFIGYAEGSLGLGQVFRNNLLAAQASGLPFGVYPFRVGVETRIIGPFMSERYDQTHAYDVNVIEVAPDYAPIVLRSIDRRLTRNSYNVLRTFWELPKAPEAWRPMLQGIDEIWAPNAFVATAFRDIFSGPVVVIPNALDVGKGPYPGRDHFGMEAARFYFLFSFDFFSSPHRKNPLGVLEAFRCAFPRGKENVGIIVKSIGAVDHYPEIKSAIQQAALGDQRIMVIDKSLPRQEVLGLIRASDSYVSLHRSEGFGLGMAEAMGFGRIVIGTNFSGNTEFLTEETGFPVPFILRPVEPHEYPWSNNQVWAEPDLEAAASTMRLVFESRDVALARAYSGQMLIRQKYGACRVGEIVKKRISQLTATRAQGFP